MAHCVHAPRLSFCGHTAGTFAPADDKTAVWERSCCRFIRNFGRAWCGQLHIPLCLCYLRIIGNYFLYQCRIFCRIKTKKFNQRSFDCSADVYHYRRILLCFMQNFVIFCFLTLFFFVKNVKVLIFIIFCTVHILFCRKKFFPKISLLFYFSMLKYTCKSVVDSRLHETAHHFPPYHIGKRLGIVRFQGVYLLQAI